MHAPTAYLYSYDDGTHHAPKPLCLWLSTDFFLARFAALVLIPLWALSFVAGTPLGWGYHVLIIDDLKPGEALGFEQVRGLGEIEAQAT
jgi:hypothetical protein